MADDQEGLRGVAVEVDKRSEAVCKVVERRDLPGWKQSKLRSGVLET